MENKKKFLIPEALVVFFDSDIDTIGSSGENLDEDDYGNLP